MIKYAQPHIFELTGMRNRHRSDAQPAQAVFQILFTFCLSCNRSGILQCYGTAGRHAPWAAAACRCTWCCRATARSMRASAASTPAATASRLSPSGCRSA